MRIVTALSTAAIWSFAGAAGWVALLLMLSLTASGDGQVAAWQKAVFTALYFPVEVLHLGESGKGLSAALVVSAWIFIPGLLLVLIVPQLDIYYYADEDDPLVLRLWPIVTYIALAALIVWLDAKTAAELGERKQRQSAVRHYAGQQPRIADLAVPYVHVFLSAALQGPGGGPIYEVRVSDGNPVTRRSAIITPQVDLMRLGHLSG